MLNFYIKSVIVYFIIFRALITILKVQMKNRTDINYNDYADKELKVKSRFSVYYVYCFIPFVRILIIGIILFISFASKDNLDKLLNKKEK